MPNPERPNGTAARLAAVGVPVRVTSRALRGERGANDPVITRGAFRSAQARALVQRVAPATVIATDMLSSASDRQRHLLTATAWLSRRPQAVLSHTSAAIVHGLPVLDRFVPLQRIHLTGPGSARMPDDVSLHLHGLAECDIVDVDGLRVTSIPRTVIDMACAHGELTGLGIADAAARRLLAGDIAAPSDSLLRIRAQSQTWRERARDELAAALSRCGRRQGIGAARRVIDLCDPAAETPLESISRWRIQAAQLPVPRCGIPVVGADGHTYWADLLWDFERVIGEADGLGKYATPEVLRREKLRQEALEAAGWVVIRWTWRDVVGHDDAFIARLSRALARPAHRR